MDDTCSCQLCGAFVSADHLLCPDCRLDYAGELRALAEEDEPENEDGGGS